MTGLNGDTPVTRYELALALDPVKLDVRDVKEQITKVAEGVQGILLGQSEAAGVASERAKVKDLHRFALNAGLGLLTAIIGGALSSALYLVITS